MPFSINWYPKGTVLEFKGALDLEQIRLLDLELYSDSRYDDQIFSIWDMLEVTALRVPMDKAKLLAAHDKAGNLHAPRIQIAFIADQPYLVSFIREYIAYCRKMAFSWRFHIVTEYEQALEWLGIESPEAA
ncbi:MAG: hypothetical protein E1N59_3162 [Puniceicoccaceae bacterium 5H]|nr:MAG: hypothetical protein E1N59_3162 [Puniceicoccaceae bacterium 5H]